MKRMIQLATLACFTLLCGVCFISCNDDAIIESSQFEETYEPFRLTASQETPSRLAIGQDGLSVLWEPGDQLVLVKKDRSIVPIYMNAELTAPSTSATFVSETGVPAGEYWVIYNYNDDLAYTYHDFSSIDAINNEDKLVLWGELIVVAGATSATISLQHLYAKVRVELQNLPSGTGLANYEIGMYASKTGFPVYNQITQSGLLNVDYVYDYNTWSNVYMPTNRRYHNIRFGRYFIPGLYDEETKEYYYDLTQKSEIEKNAALILPADVSDGVVYFYILSGNDCYEISKSNIIFEPGKSYKISLDMSTATKTTWTSTGVTLPGNNYPNEFYQLKCAKDFRHAAYLASPQYNYILMEDIDFQGDTFLPFAANHILGNGKTMKNISVDWSNEDYVGMVRYEYPMYEAGGEVMYSSMNPMNYRCTFTDLTLENFLFKGNNYVGALGATNVIADRCKLTGTSSVIGSGNYIGGFVGCNIINEEIFVSNSSIETCTIKGVDYVGGIVGKYIVDRDRPNGLTSTLRILKSCSSAATVDASGNYVGGIFGVIGNSNGYVDDVQFSSEGFSLSLFECINTGKVSGQNYVGGIGGRFALKSAESIKDKVSIMNSASEGEIEGQNYVGGIVGANYASINTCYSIGKVSASNGFVGGIVGDCYNYSFGECRIVNCYSMADISVGQGGNAGGLIGYAHWGGAYGYGVFLSNSYFAGTNTTTGYGLIGYSEGDCQINNCLTTLASLGDLGTRQANRDVNGDGVIDAQDVISDNVSVSYDNVQSILQNLNVLNANNEEAYSNVVWQGYSYDCVKFLTGLTGNIVAPGFGTEIPY